jgi:hypothetical protein
MKKAALDKYYSPGLKGFYDAIQEQIQVVRASSTSNTPSQFSHIINNIDGNSEVCKSQLLANSKHQSERMNEVVCLFKVGSPTDDLKLLSA